MTDIIGATVLLNDSVGAFLGKHGWAKSGATSSNTVDHDGDGILERKVKFDRMAVSAVVSVGEKVTIIVTGSTADARFTGTDTIRVIDPW